MGCTELQHAQHWLISLEMQVEQPLIPKGDGLSKTNISVALGGWGGCTRWDVPRDAMKHRWGSSGRVSYFCTLLWMLLSSADHMGWAVLHIWIGTWATSILCIQRQSSPWWLWPGSEQWVMGESCSVLTAHGACWISKAQANRGFTAWD